MMRGDAEEDEDGSEDEDEYSSSEDDSKSIDLDSEDDLSEDEDDEDEEDEDESSDGDDGDNEGGVEDFTTTICSSRLAAGWTCRRVATSAHRGRRALVLNSFSWSPAEAVHGLEERAWGR